MTWSRRRCVTPLVYGLAIGAVLALLYWIVRDPRLVGYVAGGLGATFLVLALAGWVLVRLLAGCAAASGVAWRYGLANIARRGRDSIVQIVAFGLGFMVLLLLALVRDDLLRDWKASLPAGRAELFHDQHPAGRRARACAQFFASAGLPRPSSCRWCARGSRGQRRRRRQTDVQSDRAQRVRRA